MISEKLLEVLSHEGAVAIASSSNNEVHIVNTWNSYINITKDGRLLIPAAGMRKTQKNVELNDKVKLTICSKDVMGYKKLGTGFLIEGTAKFLDSGSDFDMMKENFKFPSRVLEITIISAKQTL